MASNAAVNEVCALFNELEAVLGCLDDTIDEVVAADPPDGRLLARLKGLSMAASRLNREVGRQVGAV